MDRQRLRVLAIVASASMLLATAIGGFPYAAAAGPTDVEVAEAIADRAAFGLESDEAELRELMMSDRDVGSAVWGIPLTAAEMDRVDLSGRSKFANDIWREILPYAESLPTFGGAWLDQDHNGRLVVLLTRLSDDTTRELESRLPASSRGFRVDLVDFTWAELEDALERAFGEFERVAGIRPVDVAIDTRNNRLEVAVRPESLEQAKESLESLQGTLGVPIKVISSKPGADAETCGNGNTSRPRTNCWDPIRAGVRTYQFSAGNTDSGKSCTMGFHIYVDGGSPTRQYLTAGHCGYYTSPNTEQYHSTYFHGGDNIGVRKATLYNTTDHRDIMRVSIQFSTEITDRIYGTQPVYDVDDAGDYLQGDPVCASLGVSNEIDCGVVQSQSTSWDSETANPNLEVWGAGVTNLTIEFGDSGSPVFRQFEVPGHAPLWQYVPLGIVNHEPIPGRTPTMYMAKVKYALQQWPGTSIYGS